MINSKEMNVLAIITAPSNANGVPCKKLGLLAGRPLIVHTIESARRTRCISRIVVSTNVPEIAAVAKQYGVELIWRSGDASDDMLKCESSLLHAVDYLRQTEGSEPDTLVTLPYTAPLTLPEDIDGAIQTLWDENADSVMTVTPFHSFLWRRDETGNTISVNYNEHTNSSSSRFCENGVVYVMRTLGFKEAKRLLFGRVAMYEMPRNRSLVIEDPVDLQVAEVLIRHQQRHISIQALPDVIDALVLDFDGVFTDNKVIVFEDGREAVVCDRGDGWGLAQLKKLGIPILVISTEKNPVVNARCTKLGIPCLQGISEKLAVLKSWLETNGMDISQVVYVGNDVNDLTCIRAVGCGIGVYNSHPQILAAAKIVLPVPGGQGAIRELAELIEDKFKEKNNAKHD